MAWIRVMRGECYLAGVQKIKHSLEAAVGQPGIKIDK